MSRGAIRTATAAALLLAAAPAAAAEPFRIDRVRPADVPVVEAEPAVGWESHEWGKPRPPPLPEAELGRPRQDWSGLPRPRWTEGPGNAAVVRIRNLMHPDNHQSNQWLRFIQADDASPLPFACNRYSGDPRGADAYLLEASRPEGPRYTYVEAFLDGRTCQGQRLRGYQTRVLPVAGGAAYIYRTHCASCAPPSRERLHIVLPSAQRSSAFGEGAVFRYWTYLIEHIELPMGEGAAGTMTAGIEAGSIRKWNRIVPNPLPVADLELQIEVSFASGEAEPTLVVASRSADILPI
jgi:hypothetical protein